MCNRLCNLTTEDIPAFLDDYYPSSQRQSREDQETYQYLLSLPVERFAPTFLHNILVHLTSTARDYAYAYSGSPSGTIWLSDLYAAIALNPCSSYLFPDAQYQPDSYLLEIRASGDGPVVNVEDCSLSEEALAGYYLFYHPNPWEAYYPYSILALNSIYPASWASISNDYDEEISHEDPSGLYRLWKGNWEGNWEQCLDRYILAPDQEPSKRYHAKARVLTLYAMNEDLIIVRDYSVQFDSLSFLEGAAWVHRIYPQYVGMPPLYDVRETATGRTVSALALGSD
jgi:hypothetical protein